MIINHVLPDASLSKQAESFATSTLVQFYVKYIHVKLIRPADV